MAKESLNTSHLVCLKIFCMTRKKFLNTCVKKYCGEGESQHFSLDVSEDFLYDKKKKFQHIRI